MTGYSASKGRLFEFEALPMQSVALEEYRIDQAIDLSDHVVTESQQWRTYLNALALFGFKQWLSETASDLVLNWKHSSILQPQYANAIDAVCHLIAGEFKICLIAAGADNPFIRLPRAVVDLAEYAAHFYVVVRVLEEQEQALIWSFLRYDQWTAHQQEQSLQPEQNWSYEVPVAWFDRDLNHLLLHLRCLDAEAIPLPQASTIHAENWFDIQNAVSKQLSHSEARETPLWQLLTWEQGEKLLRNPSLLKWFYHLHSGDQAVERSQSFLQPGIDAGHWLQNGLDEIAQTLGWIMLPPLAMRSTQRKAEIPGLQQFVSQPTVQEVHFICKRLEQDEVDVPPEARWVYKDLILADLPLRLYAIVWLLEASEDYSDRWSLLIVLKKLSEHDTSHSITLCIKDQMTLDTKQTLGPDSIASFLYTRVVGDWNEQFSVTIALEDGMAITLPAFTFQSK